jgi:hypothetical protein
MGNSTIAPTDDDGWNAINCYEFSFVQIIIEKVQPVMIILTVITTLFSTIIFWRIIRNEQQQSGQMFKYFFVSSLAEISFLSIWLPAGFVDTPFVTFATSIYWRYFYNFLRHTFVYISNWLELAATFDCYLKITSKLKSFTTKKAFIMICLSIIIGGIINPIWIQFEFYFEGTAKNITINETTEIRYYYEIKSTFFKNTPFDKALRILMINTKELVPIVLIVIINILIFKELRKIIKKKKQMTRKGNNNTAKFNADINKFQMIIIMSLNYLILRSLYFYKLIRFIEIYTLIDSCVSWLGYFPYILSFFFKFFILYFYNKLFRKYFNSLFRCR